jgi:capsular exopolysaccharide synthesis family protein
MQEQRIATILWRGKWLILVSLVLAIALAVFITQRSKKEYAATAILQVTSLGAGSTTTAAEPLQQLQVNQTLATTYATLIVDRSFLQEIRPRVAGGAYSVGQLQGLVDAAAIRETALIKITAQGPTPDAARRVAGGVASAFLFTFRRDNGARATAQQEQIRAQITQLGHEIENLSASRAVEDKERATSLRLARAALTQQLAALVANNIAEGSSVRLTAPATASPSPVKPRPVLNILAGFMLGLILGVFLAWLREHLDRGLHSAEEAEELISAPVLAAIPLRKRYAPEDTAVSESYDVLRANLAFISLDQALQVITFTSYNPGEGKTSTVEGLAYAGIQSGLDVLIIDGDSRKPALSTRFGATSFPGLTSVVVGTATLDQAVLDIEPGLALLPAGPTPPNPPSLLSSGRMRDVLAELRTRYPLILIDSPPVAHLADPAILASISDGTILVARVGITARADLVAAVANLRHSPTPIVGAVVLRPQAVDGAYYYHVASEGRPDLAETILER